MTRTHAPLLAELHTHTIWSDGEFGIPELAALLPLTPANVGAASAAISVVVHARGVPLAEAVPASIVLHGVETAAGVRFGAGSAAFLVMPRVPKVETHGPRVWPSFGALLGARAASSAP